MTSRLKQRIAAKQRRTATVPVQVSDPGPAREALEKAERQLALLEVITAEGDEGGEKKVVEAQEARDAARKAFAEHFVEVEFAAALPADFERVVETHPDADGGWSAEALPDLAALCAVDAELQDTEWWASELASGRWSSGERASLWARLIDLNTNLPPEHLPKG